MKGLLRRSLLYLNLILAGLFLFHVWFHNPVRLLADKDRVVYRDFQVSTSSGRKSVVQIRGTRFDGTAGRAPLEGAVTLFDQQPKGKRKGFFEIGFYRYGAGLITPGRIEFWPGKSVSIANRETVPSLEVRDRGDRRAALWFNGQGYIGTQTESIGFAFGKKKTWDAQPGERAREAARLHRDGTLVIEGDLRLGSRSLKAELRRIRARIRTLESSM